MNMSAPTPAQMAELMERDPAHPDGKRIQNHCEYLRIMGLPDTPDNFVAWSRAVYAALAPAQGAA